MNYKEMGYELPNDVQWDLSMTQRCWRWQHVECDWSPCDCYCHEEK